MAAEVKGSLRFGIVGCGSIAKTHIWALTEIPGAVLAAVADVNENAAKAIAEEYGCQYYGDYRLMIQNSNADVIDICTPSGLRRDISVYAANNGKHIVLEKPIEVTTEKIDDILDAAKKSNVSVHGIFNRRFFDVYMWLKDFINREGIGQLMFSDVAMKWYRPPEYYKNTWRGTWALDGGGALMNQCIHYVDLVQWLMGMPLSVTAHTGRFLHKEIETEDTAIALLRYENDAMGMIQASTAMMPGYSARLSFHGKEGGIILENNNIVDIYAKNPSEKDEKAIKRFSAQNTEKAESSSTHIVSDYIPHKRQLINIVEAIKNNRDSNVTGYEARKSVQIIRAIYQSASTKKEIYL